MSHTDGALMELIKAGQFVVLRSKMENTRDTLESIIRTLFSQHSGDLLDRVIAELTEARDEHRRIMED